MSDHLSPTTPTLEQLASETAAKLHLRFIPSFSAQGHAEKEILTALCAVTEAATADRDKWHSMWEARVQEVITLAARVAELERDRERAEQLALAVKFGESEVAEQLAGDFLKGRIDRAAADNAREAK